MTGWGIVHPYLWHGRTTHGPPDFELHSGGGAGGAEMLHPSRGSGPVIQRSADSSREQSAAPGYYSIVGWLSTA